jgi:acyl carrier protein
MISQLVWCGAYVRIPDEQVEAELRLYLSQLAPGRSAQIAALDRHAFLWDAVDSMSLLDMVEYIERRFNVRVAPLELLPDNFGSLAQIVRFVGSHVTAQ